MAQEAKTPWQLTHFLMILCWVLWIVTFFITVTLFQAVLQIHVVAQVVQNVEKGLIYFNTDLVRSTPLNVVGRDKLDEMLVRYYLDMRYTVIPDKIEMTRRWGEGGIVAVLSSPAVYEGFRSQASKVEQMENALPRVVDVLRVERRGTYYTTDVDLYTFDGATNWVRAPKRIVLQFSYVPSRRLMTPVLANPSGFVVTRVDESDRKSATQ